MSSSSLIMVQLIGAGESATDWDISGEFQPRAFCSGCTPLPEHTFGWAGTTWRVVTEEVSLPSLPPPLSPFMSTCYCQYFRQFFAFTALYLIASEYYVTAQVSLTYSSLLETIITPPREVILLSWCWVWSKLLEQASLGFWWATPLVFLQGSVKLLVGAQRFRRRSKHLPWLCLPRGFFTDEG